MSEATDVARRLEEAWAGGDYETVRSLVAPDLVDHAAHLGEWTGVDNAIQNDQATGKSFPDRERSIEDVFGEGDKAVVRCRFQGTNDGRPSSVRHPRQRRHGGLPVDQHLPRGRRQGRRALGPDGPGQADAAARRHAGLGRGS